MYFTDLCYLRRVSLSFRVGNVVKYSPFVNIISRKSGLPEKTLTGKTGKETMYTTVLVVAVLSAALLFWFTADSVYESHLRAKENHPTLFLLTGINGKYINDRVAWIAAFRRQIVLVVVLFHAVLLAVHAF